MANVVKYSLTTQADTLKIGNVLLGTNAIEYGPTSSTKFWNGVEVPVNGYVMYIPYSSGSGMTVYSINNDTELVKIVNEIGLQNYTTAAQALAWAGTQTGLVLVNKTYPNVVTDNLKVSLDCSFVPSYPKAGTSWYDMSGNANNSILTNGPAYNGNGSIVFDGTDDYAYFSSPNSLLTPTFTVCSVITPITVAGNGTVVFTNESARLNLGIAYGGNNGGYFFITGNNGQSFNGVYGSYSFSYGTNTKYFVTWIVDIPGKNFQFWVNGTQIWSSTADLGTNFNNPTTNGFVLASRYGGGSSRVNIGISKFSFYGKVLSSSEILRNYYQASIVTDGLVLSLDAGNLVSYESGNTWYDLSANSSNGTLTNGPTFDSGNGGSIVFDGVDDRVTCAPNSITSNSLTFTIWIKRFSFGTQGTGLVFNRGGGGSTTGMNINYPTPSNGLGYHWNDDSNTYTYNPGLAIPLNTWCFCCVSVSPTQAIFQVNNNTVVRSYTNVTANTTVGTNITIGTDYTINRFVNANIAYASMYNRALSQSEILQNFNAQRARFGV